MFWDQVVFSPCLVKDFVVRDLGTPEYSCMPETAGKICFLTLCFEMIIPGEIALNLKLLTDIPSVEPKKCANSERLILALNTT